MNGRHDCVIIGSGTSGGVIAYYLTAGGMKCLLLEAGDAYNADTFPENEMDGSAQMYWGGGLELSAGAEMAFLRARCLGGTSVVNQCLLDRFDDHAWAGWQAASGVGFLSGEGMAQHYAEVEGRLSIKEVPAAHHNRNARLFVQGCEKLGYRWAPLRRGETDCAIEEGNDCIACLNGCRRDSKQSTLVTFIRWAQELGLEVRPGFQVEHLESTHDGVRLAGTESGCTQEIRAPRVVLAAGALGDVRLLLRSGFAKRLPWLGRGFYCHPQLMTFAEFDEPVDSHRGAFQACKSDEPRFRKAGFKLENVFAPPTSLAMLYPGFGARLQSFMLRYRHQACIEVAVQDVVPGRISVDSRGRLKIAKRLEGEDARRGQAGLAAVREIFESAGARAILHSPMSFGLHLMGGLAIGQDERTSVVSSRFSLHGFPNIYAADSSIFPAAPGINPALTIMALSHRASQEVLRGV